LQIDQKSGVLTDLITWDSDQNLDYKMKLNTDALHNLRKPVKRTKIDRICGLEINNRRILNRKIRNHHELEWINNNLSMLDILPVEEPKIAY
jgi:hypothetical protein